MTDSPNGAPIPAEPVRLDELHPHPRNYRAHPPDEIEHIAASIREHGLYRNVVAARDGTILAGHGVVEAARLLGYEELPVVRLDVEPDDPRALKVLVGDNEIARGAMPDDRALTELLRDLALDDDLDLLGTGFDERQIANLVYVTRPASEIADLDAAREWVGLPAYDEEDPERRELRPQVVIYFSDEEERERWVRDVELGIKDRRGGRVWSTTVPYEPKDDLASVRFDPEEEG